MVGYHHRLNGCEFEQALGVGDGQQATEPGLEEKHHFLAEGFKADKCHSLIYNFKTS